MLVEDDDRYATQRATSLARITDLRRTEAEAIAYSERGYSSSGIAKRMDTTESTVKSYLERAMALYGLEIAFPLTTEELENSPPSHERVAPDYYRSLPHRSLKKDWLKYVQRHSERIPVEWQNAVFENAREDGLFPLEEE